LPLASTATCIFKVSSTWSVRREIFPVLVEVKITVSPSPTVQNRVGLKAIEAAAVLFCMVSSRGVLHVPTCRKSFTLINLTRIFTVINQSNLLALSLLVKLHFLQRGLRGGVANLIVSNHVTR
jgi:hypothetical protein